MLMQWQNMALINLTSGEMQAEGSQFAGNTVGGQLSRGMRLPLAESDSTGAMLCSSKIFYVAYRICCACDISSMIIS